MKTSALSQKSLLFNIMCLSIAKSHYFIDAVVTYKAQKIKKSHPRCEYVCLITVVNCNKKRKKEKKKSINRTKHFFRLMMREMWPEMDH